METEQQVRARLDGLHQAVWELAAVAIALGDDRAATPEARAAAGDVLTAAGYLAAGSGPGPSGPGLEAATAGDPRLLASQAAAPILQAAALISGASLWSAQDDQALLAQGRASAQGAAAFKAFALPMLQGLDELLQAPAAAMLDVGVGVGAMAVAYCQLFPNLRVVGIDVLPRAIALARDLVAREGLTERIELRHQDLAALDDREAYCLAWLPAPFIPSAALEAGLPRIVASLVPGGWLMLAHGKFDGGLAGSLTKLQTVAFGGTILDDAAAHAMMSGASLDQVATLPTPPGAPAITIGRRPTTR
jgi:hypothetical protein